MNKEKVFNELLVLQSQQGNTKAFELLVKRWNKRLISFAYKYLKNIDQAKDVVQDSWISIHKGLSRLSSPKKFNTWAFRITYNKVMDEFRKKNEFISDEGLEVAESEELATIDTDKWLSVADILKQLPPAHKSILKLFYLEQQSIKEISVILALPEGTVKSRIFYARELLKKKYKEVYYEK